MIDDIRKLLAEIKEREAEARLSSHADFEALADECLPRLVQAA